MELSEIKQAMAHKDIVSYQDINYYITGCTLRLKNNEWCYDLELHDLKANSVVIANMSKVKMVTDE